MNKIARNIYNPIRTVIVTLLAMLVAGFALAYFALALPPVQNYIKHRAEAALSEYLHTDVTIGKINLQPFDRVTLEQVAIPDQTGDSLINVDRLGAGIDIFESLSNDKIVISYAEIIGLHGKVKRPDPDSPTNAQFLIDALKPKDNKEPTPFDLQIHNVVLRKCDLSYDVDDQPLTPGKFNPNHIRVEGLRADLTLPRVKNNDFVIDLKRMSLAETSGFVLKNLATTVTIDDNHLEITEPHIELPHSDITLGTLAMEYPSLKEIGNELKNTTLPINLTADPLTPSDLSAFVPKLADFTQPLKVNTSVNINKDLVDISRLSVKNNDGLLALDATGTLVPPADGRPLTLNLPHLAVKAQSNEVKRLLDAVPGVSPQARQIIERCGNITVDAAIDGGNNNLNIDGNVGTSLGDANISGRLTHQGSTDKYAGHVQTSSLNIGHLLNRPDLGEVALDATVDLVRQNSSLNGTVDGKVDHFDFKGYRYHNITAGVDINGKDIAGNIAMNDPAGTLSADGKARLDGTNSFFDITAQTQNLNLGHLGLGGKALAGSIISCDAQANITGNNIDNILGQMSLDHVSIRTNKGPLDIEHLSIVAEKDQVRSLTLESDFINAKAEGDFRYATVVPTVKRLIALALPELAKVTDQKTGYDDIDFAITVEPDDQFQALFNLPVKLLDTTTLTGHVSSSNNAMELHVDAPYLLQGKNIIERSHIDASLDSATHVITLAASTIYPSKKGKINVNLNADAADNQINTDLAWNTDWRDDIKGNISLECLLNPTPGKMPALLTKINQSTIMILGTPLEVQEGSVEYNDNKLTIHNLALRNDKQFLSINGRASKDPEDQLCLELNDISLDYIFETLNIDNVKFGGKATGKFYASDVFSGTPRLYTPELHVDDIAYNYAVMGDADIKSHWDPDQKGVIIDAEILQENGDTTYIDGGIYIGSDSLHLVFDANHANVAFMKPFMEAFTSDVRGQVSGKAVLLGNFHDVNCYGNVIADSLLFKLDYTNVYYSCAGDTVKMVPNLITFDNVTIYDREGHKGRLDGWLRHKAFHDPVFRFNVTNARNLLCYDTDTSINPDWYGTIYGNGSAFVSGEPGTLDIKVNMQSAPQSRFTFVLSDTQVASEYKFITYHDRNHVASVPAGIQVDSVPDIVRQMHMRANMLNKEQEERPTHYNIELIGDITPEAQLTLIMDPVGGDNIKATGAGNMRLTYNDAGELGMYGKYTLEKGSYTFTLQDIIIKDFSIRNGSSISFQGDPYSATLDIEAVYSLNANLRDLDVSFDDDNELQRTNVPVHALLRAKGSMNEPDISFDLEFPTLSSDSYSKVRSIINTDDQMNRQIIYLLALNRFYTPDYMSYTRNNNELSSVASSTISSQLSSILGKMTDKVSITPNFRTNKGDFSDMEVDLALSSQLLDNRLLLNGNFGYRDNTYNARNNNFIGDFDIEYLLNRRGTIRLKAYNHFNDQNYYVRNALTTQGVGVVWKHDFNNPFKRPKKKVVLPADSVQSVTSAPDSVDSK